ncbi:MAG: hypothetical protein GY822_06835 [Deltaproteobacteria bacterium]|nr:hypothetical protein [Deltaproteobacteria bacterium]
MKSFFKSNSFASLTSGVLTTLVLLPLCTGCADFDRQDRIEDTRILAVRTEPAEVKFSPLYSLLPPSERPPGFRLPSPGPMEVTVYAYDPRGGQITTTTQMCPPNAPDRSCLNDYEPEDFLAQYSDEQREVLDTLYVPSKTDQTLSFEEVALDPTGRLKNLGFSFDINDVVIDSIVQGNLSVFPVYPKIVVEVQNQLPLIDPDNPKVFEGASKERAYKRIPVSMDLADPSLPEDIRAALFGFLGFPACENTIEEDGIVDGDAADCLYALQANKNPDLLGFTLLQNRKEPVYHPNDPQQPIITTDGPLTLGTTSVISASRSDVIHLDPVFSAGVSEPYQVFGFDLETESLTLANRNEDIVVSWYTTGGDVSRVTSTVLLHLTMGIDWVLPVKEDQNFEAGDRVTLVAVARDQRGGVSVAQIIVELR